MTIIKPIHTSRPSGGAVQRRLALGKQTEMITMLFALWAVIGLFVDGHSHAVGNPETFFSPAHGLLYSGFLAGAAWMGGIAIREAKIRPPAALSFAPDRLMVVGFGLFALGGLGDLAWHETFGFETGLEPSSSAPHLVLMLGGVLVVGGPFRASVRFKREASVPATLSLMMSAAIPFFFLSPFSPFTYAVYHEALDGPNDERILRGVIAPVVTTVFLVGVALIARRQWRLPYGAITAMTLPIAVAMSGIRGFDIWLPIVGVLVAGLVGDECLRRGVRAVPMAGAMSAVLWSLYFIGYHLQREVAWSATVWSGAIVWPTLTALAAGFLFNTRLGSLEDDDV